MIKTSLVGRLVADPTTNNFNGTECCSFRVAADSNRKSTDGSLIAGFFNVTVFSNIRTACMQYLHKGSRVFVDGSLCPRTYTDKSGLERTSLDLNCNDIVFLDTSGGNGKTSTGTPKTSKTKTAVVQKQAYTEDDDELPF